MHVDQARTASSQRPELAATGAEGAARTAEPAERHAAAPGSAGYASHAEFVGGLGRLLGQSDQAIMYAGNARTGSRERAAGAATAGAETDRRAPDGRDGRRLRNDEIFRRPAGGGREGSHLDNDWAGRAILGRYLSGGGDWTIRNDPSWSQYMMGNQSLRNQLTDPTQKIAQDALAAYQANGTATGSYRQTLHASIENGEGIVGYQYLHGTNANVGDFGMDGQTQVRRRADGNYEVTIQGNYTWNDVIDPNPQYATDTWKSRIAEAVTLGQADAYDIHISWQATSTVVLDPAGNVLSMSGYPAP